MKLSLVISAAVILGLMVSPFGCLAGGPSGAYSTPLDPALIGFKEHGIWYFLCEAPVHLYRIPPHYMMVNPTPPCGPAPPLPPAPGCAPVGPPRPRR
jgi:hypothetical protein